MEKGAATLLEGERACPNGYWTVVYSQLRSLNEAREHFVAREPAGCLGPPRGLGPSSRGAPDRGELTGSRSEDLVHGSPSILFSKCAAGAPMRIQSRNSLALRLALLAVICCSPGFSALAAPSIAVESGVIPMQGCYGCSGSITGTDWAPKPGYPELSGFLTPTDGTVSEKTAGPPLLHCLRRAFAADVDGSRRADSNLPMPGYMHSEPADQHGPAALRPSGDTGRRRSPGLGPPPDRLRHLDPLRDPARGLSGSKFSMDVSCSACNQ